MLELIMVLSAVLGKYSDLVVVSALLGVVIVLSMIRHVPLLEMIPLMLVLLMSAVPVALPVMFTVSTAVGAKELAKRGVLVTRLSVIEDAATMDVLCVDKTGTTTMNQLTITGVIPLEEATEFDMLFAAVLASQLRITFFAYSTACSELHYSNFRSNQYFVLPIWITPTSPSIALILPSPRLCLLRVYYLLVIHLNRLVHLRAILSRSGLLRIPAILFRVCVWCSS